jgi:hypothetical protein
MPIFEKPVDPAEIDADGLAYEVVARLQKQRGVSVSNVGTEVVKPLPRDEGMAGDHPLAGNDDAAGSDPTADIARTGESCR